MISPFDFTGYRIAIAGGSKGIGRAVALGFLEGGAQVAVCARTGRTGCVVERCGFACKPVAHAFL